MKRIILLTLFFLTACNSVTQTSTPSIDDETPDGYSFATGTPTITPTYEGCYFVWAYHALPEISEKVDKAIKTLQPDASGGAQAYGEDCIYADGHAEFSAMETDFFVMVRVKNLSDEKKLGDWIYAVLKIIEGLPREEIPGAQAGKVQLQFVKSGSEYLYVNIPLDEYRKLVGDLRGVELFRHFRQNP